MKELSLNILDITENSVKAGATLTEIFISENEEKLVLTITDNGSGMTEEVLKGVINPFYTTRTTRKVGMGLPLLKLAAEQTGGKLEIFSKHYEKFPNEHGTKVSATFYKNHIDCVPLGDVVETVKTLIQGHPDTDFLFIHKTQNGEVGLDTRELRQTLEDVPLNTYEVIKWIEEYLREQYLEIQKA
ncbi:MAG: sensor histidine kinase [Ruminococcaceae bacterium]|nr:sensor histidine kinase [Oscillospiraceae bacterium]